MKSTLKVVFITSAFFLIVFTYIIVIKHNKTELNKESDDNRMKSSNILENSKLFNNSVKMFETIRIDTDETYMKNPNLVSLEISEYDIQNNKIKLTITDLNEIGFKWTQRYSIEKKNNNIWEELERINPEKALLISSNYDRNEKNQVVFVINLNYDYGKLGAGIYRVVKKSEDNIFYSNEIEINI